MILNTCADCLHVIVCLFGTIVTQIIHQEFFLPVRPGGGEGRGDSLAYAIQVPGRPGYKKQNYVFRFERRS